MRARSFVVNAGQSRNSIANMDSKKLGNEIKNVKTQEN